MVRKSDRNKAKTTSAPEKSTDKTPRKSSRYSRRKKKSSSASESEDVPVEAESVKETTPAPSEKNAEEDATKRRHTRSHPRASNSDVELKGQGPESEWKEDADFWGANVESNTTAAPPDDPTKEDGEGGIWKVQNSNGSGGEIQKLKICRQRPADATDSSSPSPSKDSSPWRKRSGHSRKDEDESPGSPSSTPLDSEVTSSTTSGAAPEKSEQMDADSSGIHATEVEEGGKIEEGSSTVNQEERARKEEGPEEGVSSNPSNEEASEPIERPSYSPIPQEKATPDSSTRKPEDEEDKSEPDTPKLQEKAEADDSKSKVECEGSVVSEAGDDSQPLQNTSLQKETKEKPTVSAKGKEKEMEMCEEIFGEKSGEAKEEKADETKEEEAKKIQEEKTGESQEEKSDKTNVKKVAVESKEVPKKKEKVDAKTERPDKSKPKTAADNTENTEVEEGEISPVRKGRKVILINKPSETVKPTVFIRRNDGVDDPATVCRKRRISGNKRKPEILPLEAAGPIISSQSLKLIVPDAKPITDEELDFQEEAEKKKDLPEDVLEVGELESIEDGEEREEGEVEKAPPAPPKRPKPITIERKVTPEKKEPPPRLQSKKTYITFESTKEPKKEVKEEKPTKLTIIRTDDRIKVPPVRKISVVSDTIKKARSPSPTTKKATEVLFITNLVRPFTVPQLRELLARTGTIAQNGFYIDKIKSKCYVKYTDVEMAIETRHALHGVRWPVNNPKTLRVEFASAEDMAAVQKLAENESLARADPSEPGWLNEQSALKPVRRVTAVVREWDVGKVNLMEVEAAEKENKAKEDWAKPKEKEIGSKRRPNSPDSKDHTARKIKKKDTDTSALILSTLFRKTKATPCIFWLPLTPAQIAAKIDIKKQQRAAELERRLADPKKLEHSRRDRERDRDRDRERRKK